jgi:hypothetical protein
MARHSILPNPILTGKDLCLCWGPLREEKPSGVIEHGKKPDGKCEASPRVK